MMGGKEQNSPIYISRIIPGGMPLTKDNKVNSSTNKITQKFKYKIAEQNIRTRSSHSNTRTNTRTNARTNARSQSMILPIILSINYCINQLINESTLFRRGGSTRRTEARRSTSLCQRSIGRGRTSRKSKSSSLLRMLLPIILKYHFYLILARPWNF